MATTTRQTTLSWLASGGIDATAPLPADVLRALDWMRAHPGEAVRVDVLADIAAVRPRTLEAHFRQFLGAPPSAVVRRLRLAHAHARLSTGDDAIDVTTVALQSGFSQLGRFAGEYRRRFGEAPSQTLRRSRRAKAAEPASDEALRLTLRALPAAFAVAAVPCSTALADAQAAQRIAPRYALPKAIAAWCLMQRTAQRFGDAGPDDAVSSRRLVDEACALAPHDPLVLTLSAGALTLAHRVGEADGLIERALAIDPRAPWAWLRRGWLSAYRGDAPAALRELGLVVHLMPLEPLRHLTLIGIGAAHFAAGRYDRAAAWCRDGVNACPESFWASRIVAAAAAHSGARDAARRIVRTIRRRDPALTVEAARSAWPFRASFIDRLGDGLRIGGLPLD